MLGLKLGSPRTLSGGTTGGLPRAIVSAARVRFVRHAVWNFILLFALSARLVPPIAVANGELAGKSTDAKPTTTLSSPKSPLEKLTPIPCAAAISKMRVSRLNRAGLPRASKSPQLLELTLLIWWRTAYLL